MSRPKKCRRICALPGTLGFLPEDWAGEGEAILLTVEEYTAIALIDREGLSQEQCAGRMEVARTTVQQIYSDARRKLADALVEGRPLRIGGGNYRLCGEETGGCGFGPCGRPGILQKMEIPKGEKCMRIAVTYENGEVYQHFGHTQQFKIYDVQDGKILSSQVVDTNGSGHGALAGVLGDLHVDALICGGIGGGARMALDEAGIRLYGGVSGSADQAAEALVSGKLSFDPEARCEHHEHHGEGHSCGSHTCGSHSCH